MTAFPPDVTARGRRPSPAQPTGAQLGNGPNSVGAGIDPPASETAKLRIANGAAA